MDCYGYFGYPLTIFASTHHFTFLFTQKGNQHIRISTVAPHVIEGIIKIEFVEKKEIIITNIAD